MSSEDVFTLEGKLVNKPRTGFNYARTRRRITEKLLTFEIGEEGDTEKLFKSVGAMKVEDEKFTIPVKMNRHIFNLQSEGIEREMALMDLLEQVQKFFGIGLSKDEKEKIKAKDEAVEGMVEDTKELEKEGILPIAFFTDFAEKKFEE